MNDVLRGKKVAIIGGGPGGLLLGRLLQQAGIHVKVYERDASRYIRQQGSTLDMHYDTGLKAIEIAGLLDEFKKRYRKGADTGTVANGQLQVLLNDQVTSRVGFGDEAFRPEIDRATLRDMLIGSLDEENLIWDSRFINMTPKDEGWQLEFENGSSVYADLVIAADGANSKLRSYVTPIRAVYSGATSIEINLPKASVHAPRIWELAKGGSLHALENGRTLFSITKGDGTLTSLIGFKTEEHWLATSGLDLNDKASVLAWFRTEYADWSPTWEALFTSEEVSFTSRVWYHFPQDQHWEALPNLTLIGDAAHRIPPYAGEGANQALADALDLYEALCIESHSSTRCAIESYEQKMFTRSSEITQVSVYNTLKLHEMDNIQFLMGMYAGADSSNENVNIN